MASKFPTSSKSSGADKAEKKDEGSPVKSADWSPKDYKVYTTDMWGTCEDGLEKLNKYDIEELESTGYRNMWKGKLDDKAYALKRIPKTRIKKTGELSSKQARRLKREVRALTDLKDSPFVNTILEYFQTPTEIVYVLEFTDDGDLHDLTYRPTQEFTEREIRFYLAEVVVALETVHKKNIVHRAVDPTHLLLSNEHVQIAGFGYCNYFNVEDKEEGGRNSPIATDAFVAPELLIDEWRTDNAHFVQDWYAVGVLGLRMYAGAAHFPYGERHLGQRDWSKHKVYAIRAMTEEHRPNIPTRGIHGSPISQDLRDLLTGLLQVRYHKRLGYQGADEIKQHPFFKDVNWEEAAARKLKTRPRF